MPLFTDLDRLKAELDALRPLAPEQEARVLQKFRLDWNYNSNAIEGNSLTLGETRSLLLHGLTAEGKPLRDHLDIKGHDEAVRGLEEIVHDERPLTEQFIREMHQVLLGEAHYKAAYTATGQPTRQRIVPGQYKSGTNNVTTATGETFYFATPEETPALMHDLVTWYRQEVETPTLHPVELAAAFHHRFVIIHPFDDGNGRMSRLLMNLILLRHGYPMTVIKADDRNRYLAALAEADAGEPEPFLHFIIENVEASLRLMIRAARGESIDEPSDLDKKLALLKIQLIEPEYEAPTSWNTKYQPIFFEKCLHYWLNDLSKQSQKFDFAFLSKTFQAAVFEDIIENKKELYSSPIPGGIHGLIRENMAHNSNLVRSLVYVISWESLKKHSLFFNVSLGIRFSFRKTEFVISYGLAPINPQQTHRWEIDRANQIFRSPYQTEYDHAQIHEINHQLANKVYDFIAAKLAEADTPPA